MALTISAVIQETDVDLMDDSAPKDDDSAPKDDDPAPKQEPKQAEAKSEEAAAADVKTEEAAADAQGKTGDQAMETEAQGAQGVQGLQAPGALEEVEAKKAGPKPTIAEVGALHVLRGGGGECVGV